MGVPSWDDDGVGDGPSSMDVLLQWLEAPGNATRWLKSAAKGDGSRRQMTSEIFDRLVAHGINYRTIGSINTKLWALEKQLKNTEHWLRSRGLHQYDSSKKTEREVLLMCPYYPEIQPLLRPKWSVAIAAPVEAPATTLGHQSDYHEDADVESSADGGFQSSDGEEEELRGVGSKRGGSLELHDAKHARVRDQPLDRKLEDTKRVGLLKAERREFFKLVLQVKRDQAVLVRAKARKELLDLGVSADDVDRLMPL